MSIPVGSLEIRMARLEGAYEQINVRLSDLSAELQAEVGTTHPPTYLTPEAVPP